MHAVFAEEQKTAVAERSHGREIHSAGMLILGDLSVLPDQNDAAVSNQHHHAVALGSPGQAR